MNVSPIQLKSSRFVAEIEQILQKTDLEPHFLELEITESVIQNSQESKKSVKPSAESRGKSGDG